MFFSKLHRVVSYDIYPRTDNLYVIFMKNTPAVYAALFLGVLAISTSAIFVKFADAPSSAIALYRLGITAAVLLPFLVFSRKRLQEAALLS